MVRKSIGKFLLFLSIIPFVAIGSTIDDEDFMLCVMGVDFFGASPSQCLWVIETFGPSEELLNIIRNEWTLVGVLSSTSPEVLTLAQLFIDNGIDVDAPQIVLDRKLLPIHSSILTGELDAFNLLIENGADINQIAETSHGTALQFAHRMQEINHIEVRVKMIAVMEAMK